MNCRSGIGQECEFGICQSEICGRERALGQAASHEWFKLSGGMRQFNAVAGGTATETGVPPPTGVRDNDDTETSKAITLSAARRQTGPVPSLLLHPGLELGLRL